AALVITEIGWLLAMPLIHDGIDATGTYALDTNVSGNTRSDIPCAACALPANRPMQMNTQAKAKPNSTAIANAAAAALAGASSRNPTAKPIAVVTANAQTSVVVSASARPATADKREIGSDRSRSTKPCSTSSATPAAAPAPTNSTVVTTKPGTRKL